MKIKHIISNVQSYIGDESQEKIPQANYIDWIEQIAIEVGTRADLWVGRYEKQYNLIIGEWETSELYNINDVVVHSGSYYVCIYQHTSGNFTADASYWKQATEWTDSTSYTEDDMVFTEGPKFYKALISHTSNYLTQPPSEGIWELISDYITNRYHIEIPKEISGRQISLFRISRVARRKADTDKWTEYYEASKSAVSRTIGGNVSYPLNDMELKNSYTIKLASEKDIQDGTITLTFTEAFDSGETVIVDYVTLKPWDGKTQNQLSKWTTDMEQEILDFMYETFFWGLLWKASSYLFYRGNEIYQTKMLEAMRNYRSFLQQVSSYIKLPKDTRSVIIPRPRKL